MNGPAHARQIVTREFARVLPPERLEELKLMVSELVTRAVVHGNVRDDDTITLDLRVNGNVRCEVAQSRGPVTSEEVRSPGSWGMRLVDRLARRWGVTHSADATRLWFETPRS